MEETGENYRSNYDHIELGVLDSSPIVGFSDANHLDKIIDGGMYSTFLRVSLVWHGREVACYDEKCNVEVHI